MLKRMRTGLAVAAAAAAVLAACSRQPAPAGSSAAAPAAPAESPTAAPAAGSGPARAAPGAGRAGAGLPARIVAARGGFVPEGLEYDRTQRRFLTGSLAEGTIFRIDPGGGVVPFVQDPELVSSVGIEVDEARGRLLVCNSDRAVFDGKSRGQAKLGIYDLATGERRSMIDLTAAIRRPPPDAAFFANDVTVGDDGTAYVTDSRQNVVYAVGAGGKPVVLFRFEAKDGALNGIVYVPGRALLIVIGGPHLYRLTVGDPAKMNEVQLPEPMDGADGMVFLPDGRLAVVSNSRSRVVALKSGDDWYSAAAAGVGSFDGQATTAAVADGTLYVVKPHFNDAAPPVIERVTLR